jgi:alpha-1,2-mannosyltransferase
MAGAFVAGVALMPVPATIRWLVLLLGGFDWPVIYGLRLGQVSALLFLLFVLAWRWLDRQERFGLAVAGGALAKVQPGLLLVWALLTRRWRAVGVGLGALAVASIVATLVVGVGAWADYLRLLGAVNAPVTTEHNFTPGAVLYQAGVAAEVAGVVQLAAMVATVVAVLAAIRWATPQASLIVAIVASQLLSPLLWDHYAVVLLVPTAWLLARGQAWAIAIPLATWFPLVSLTPAAVYPFLFGVGIVAPLVLGVREASQPRTNGAATAVPAVG